MRQMGDLQRGAGVALAALQEVGAVVPGPCRSLVPEMRDWLARIRDAAGKARRLGHPPAGVTLPTDLVRVDLAPLADAFTACAAQ
jgi:hypothetical protein